MDITICGCSYTWGWDTATLSSYPVRISCAAHVSDPQPERPILLSLVGT